MSSSVDWSDAEVLGPWTQWPTSFLRGYQNAEIYFSLITIYIIALYDMRIQISFVVDLNIQEVSNIEMDFSEGGRLPMTTIFMRKNCSNFSPLKQGIFSFCLLDLLVFIIFILIGFRAQKEKHKSLFCPQVRQMGPHQFHDLI